MDESKKLSLKFSSDQLKRALRGRQSELADFVDLSTPIIQSRVAVALKRRAYQAGGRQIRQEVEDLTQEVFVSLFAQGARVLRSWQPEKGLSLESFISLVADRQVASILRTGKRNPWTEDPTMRDDLERHAQRTVSAGRGALVTSAIHGEGPEGRVASSELLRKIIGRLRENLSPLGFHLFNLICVEERTVTEVCEEMDMSVDAVYVWRGRLVRLARKIYGEILSEKAPSPRSNPVRQSAR